MWACRRMWRGGNDFMSESGESENHYPIILEYGRSREYKKLSYIAALVSILMLIAFVVAILVIGYENVPQPFSITPIITIIALANLGNCDEVSILEINEVGLSIWHSNHPSQSFELKWLHIFDIKLVEGDGFEIVFLDSRPLFPGLLTGGKRLTVFFGFSPYDLHRLLMAHWKRNVPSVAS